MSQERGHATSRVIRWLGGRRWHVTDFRPLGPDWPLRMRVAGIEDTSVLYLYEADADTIAEIDRQETIA